MLGATGTIGQATVRALVSSGHDVVCLVRARTAAGNTAAGNTAIAGPLDGAELRVGDVTNAASISLDGFRGERFDAVVSCLASRTGAPQDAWAIDHQAHVHALKAARIAGVSQFVLLSAICVQKPLLAFQHAKLAFEKVLIDGRMTYSIVRPTAYFKSLSGQIERVKQGKSFLVFGDGRLTACKPISDRDLANYLVRCLDDVTLHNRVLPIGGPGNAITPREQGEKLFELFKRTPKFKHVPVGMLDGIVAGLSTLGRVVPALARKAELARIGRYYATESMLVLNSATGCYDADATPSTGSDTLFEYYANVANGGAVADRGEHAVF
ncbi:MAG: NAD(P)H-binding protein [Gemmatimonadaceae bacterium]